MKRFLGSLSRRSSSSDSVDHRDDTPEAIIAKELTAFCESNSSSHDTNHQGNEFVHLPQIVETAESSPSAAKEAALRIRKYLADPAGTPNHVQYNALMITRILVDNPGHTFTRNFDAKFVATIKDLLRAGRDWHVQSYLRQYLDSLEQQRSWDEDLKLLLQMWAKEKSKPQRGLIDRFPMASGVAAPPLPPHPYRNAYAGGAQASARQPPNTLPNAEELAARVEEAKNSAKLLTQFVQSTPPAELEDNELVKEFVDRCRAASRLIQGYIHSTNPAPDEDTLLTLIETNDEISVALSQQQRAMLKARKIRGSSSPSSSNVNSPEPTSQSQSQVFASGAASPMEQPLPAAPVAAELPSSVTTGGRTSNATTAAPTTGTTGRYEYRSEDFQVQNPFADDYVTDDSDHGRNQTHQSQRDRVHFQPNEQER